MLKKETKQWIQLIAGLLSIYCFVLFAGQLRKNSSSLTKIGHEIEQQGLEAGALFYSESPKAVESGFVLQQKVNQ